MAGVKSIAVGLIGPGLVGKALLEQLEQIGKVLGGQARVTVAGVINSSKMLLTNEVRGDDRYTYIYKYTVAV